MIEIIILRALKDIRNTFLAVLLIKLCVLMINLVNQLFFKEEKMKSIDLLEQFFKKVINAKKSNKKAS